MTHDTYPDPFGVILAPTKNNFKGGIPEAIRYYEARAAKAREAEGMLLQGVELAQRIGDKGQSALQELARLSPEHRDVLGLHELDSLEDSLEPLTGKLAPMIVTFTAAAEQYAKRAELLEATISALRAAL